MAYLTKVMSTGISPDEHIHPRDQHRASVAAKNHRSSGIRLDEVDAISEGIGDAVREFINEREAHPSERLLETIAKGAAPVIRELVEKTVEERMSAFGTKRTATTTQRSAPVTRTNVILPTKPEHAIAWVDGMRSLAGWYVRRNGTLWFCRKTTTGTPGILHDHWKRVTPVVRISA